MPLLPGADLKDILQQKWKNISQCLDSATSNAICTLAGLVSEPGGENQTLPKRHLVFTYGTLKRGEPNHYHFLNAENGNARLIGRARTTQAWPLIVTTKWNLPFLVWSQGHGKVVLGEVYEVDDKMLQFADKFEGHPEVYHRDRILVTLTDEPELEQPTTDRNHQHQREHNHHQQSNSKPWWVPEFADSAESHLNSVLNHFRQMDLNKGQSNRSTQNHTSSRPEVQQGDGVVDVTDGSAYAPQPQTGRTIECWAYFMKQVRPAMLDLPSYENYTAANLEVMEYDPVKEIQGIEDIMRALDALEVNL